MSEADIAAQARHDIVELVVALTKSTEARLESLDERHSGDMRAIRRTLETLKARVSNQSERVARLDHLPTLLGRLEDAIRSTQREFQTEVAALRAEQIETRQQLLVRDAKSEARKEVAAERRQRLRFVLELIRKRWPETAFTAFAAFALSRILGVDLPS